MTRLPAGRRPTGLVDLYEDVYMRRRQAQLSTGEDCTGERVVTSSGLLAPLYGCKKEPCSYRFLSTTHGDLTYVHVDIEPEVLPALGDS